MEPEERIKRMEADGILTAGQAAMLRESLGSLGAVTTTPAPSAHGAIPGWVLGTGVLVLLGAGVFLLAGLVGGGPDAIQDVTQTLNQPGGYGEMNKPLSIVLGLAVLIVPPLLIWVWLHNSLVAREEKVFEAWAQTESNFQRRADLIPGLVDAVSRYLKHESETVTAVARERAAAHVPQEIDKLVRAEKESSDLLREGGAKIIEDETRMERLVEAQRSLQRSMNNLFAVAEAYPELRSADQFLELQAQLEGTENRINVARMRFNDAVRDYNATTRMLPWSLAAALGGFQRKAYFRSEEDARRAPGLDFD